MRIQCFNCNTVTSRVKKPVKFKCKVCGCGSFHYSIIQTVDAEDRRNNKEIKKHYSNKIRMF